MKNLALIFLAVWLIAAGLLPLLNLRIAFAEQILNLLAVAAGILLLLGGRQVKLGGRIAVFLLAVYLVLVGLLPLLSINVPAAGILISLLAVASGVLLLLKR